MTWLRRPGWHVPAVVLLLVVVAWPLGRTAWTSMHRSSLTAPRDDEFVGLANYVDLVTTRSWWLAVASSLVVVAAVVITQLVLGLVLGSALHRAFRDRALARVVVLVPLGLLSLVSVVTWRDAIDTGYLNTWFDLGTVGTLGQTIAVTLAETWRGTGLVVVVVALSLDRVPAALSAAATADGATGFQRWRTVVLPSIGPAVAGVAAFRVLDTFRVIDGPLVADGRGNELRTAPLLTWTTEFSAFELGLGAAMSVLLVLAAAVLAAVVVPLVRLRRYV